MEAVRVVVGIMPKELSLYAGKHERPVYLEYLTPNMRQRILQFEDLRSHIQLTAQRAHDVFHQTMTLTSITAPRVLVQRPKCFY